MGKYEELAPLIDRISKKVASDYPDIDWEDVRQELSLFVIQNSETLKTKDEGGNPAWILNRVAQSYCNDQRTEHLTLSPQYAYKPSDIKKILETAFFADAVVDTHVPDDAKSERGLDAVEIASDVKAAYDRLKVDDQKAIFKRYVLNEIPANNSYDRKKLNTAVKRLTQKLNTYRGKGPMDIQRRRAISNAGARARISEAYET